MGKFLDYVNSDFTSVRNSDFVDKSGLISVLNGKIDSEKRFVCISRPRRFGKSVAAKMLYAYYDRSCDSHNLFDDLEIAKSPDYETHLNQYPTIFLDWNRFADTDTKNVVKNAQKAVIEDLRTKYSFIKADEDKLMNALVEINEQTGDRFIFIIDEWDRLVREVDKPVQEEYVNLLRAMFKTNSANKVFLLVYMTGILPIIKVEAQSALNNFDEFSVIRPVKTAKYYGFTPDEVRAICEKHGLDFELMKHAYDGYIIGSEKSIFNPYSVMLAAEDGEYNSHWSKSASYTTIEHYIEIDHDAVQQKIIRMLNGESVTVDDMYFRESLCEIQCCDSVLALFILLGLLTYDQETFYAKIPNRETADFFKEQTRQLQIKNKNYPAALQGFSKWIILVGINWSKRKAKHDVKIEVIE